MPSLTRRSLLAGAAGAAGALVLGACSGDDDSSASTSTSAPTGPSTTSGGDLVLGEAFDRNGLVVAGIAQRAAYLLFVASGGLVRPEEAPEALTFDVSTEDGTAVGSVEVARHGDDIARVYYPLVMTFPTVGMHRVRTQVDGQSLESLLNVNNPATSALAQVGAPLPAPPTPTLQDPLDTQTICTRTPPCPFHDVSLADAVGRGPVAFLVATPAYCQTAICGPVVDQLVDVAPATPGLTAVHLEVYPYAAPPDGQPNPLVTDPFALTYEPVLFVTDASGAVTARLDNIWDGTELAAALATRS